MRVNKVNITIGKRGSGKTYYTIHTIINNVHKKFPNKRILVVDTLDHPDYRQIPTITANMLSKWKGKGIYRIYDKDTNYVLEQIAEHFTNGLLIFEDASKYIEKKLPQGVRFFVIDSKQRNIDIIFQFHSFPNCPPELFRLSDSLTLFKCSHPYYRKKEFHDYEEVLRVWDSVNQDDSPYSHATVKIY